MKLIVMLIWGGAMAHGGPATIQGFETFASCEAARPVVISEFRTLSWSSITVACVELSK